MGRRAYRSFSYGAPRRTSEGPIGQPPAFQSGVTRTLSKQTFASQSLKPK